MREIKFRVWDASEHNFLYWGSGNGDTGFWESCIFIAEEFINQYTGLKDKNGVEIYSGDILKDKRKTDSSNDLWIGVIIDDEFGGMSLNYKRYIDGAFKIGTPTNDPQTASYINESLEVIGNIYQNPELLEEK